MKPGHNWLVCGKTAAMFATVQETPMTALLALKPSPPGSIHAR